MTSAFLEGERLYLRPLEEADAQGPYLGWLNDAEVCRGNSHHVYPFSRKDAATFIASTVDSKSAVVLAIVLKEGNQHIGNIALQKIHWIHRTAEFAILLGEKTQWGKGYALEAARLIVAHGFTTLGLQRIECGTFDTNSGMRKLALSLGMKEEGQRRKAAFKDGAFVDVVEFGLLKEEFLDARSGRT